MISKGSPALTKCISSPPLFGCKLSAPAREKKSEKKIHGTFHFFLQKSLVQQRICSLMINMFSMPRVRFLAEAKESIIFTVLTHLWWFPACFSIHLDRLEKKGFTVKGDLCLLGSTLEWWNSLLGEEFPLRVDKRINH